MQRNGLTQTPMDISPFTTLKLSIPVPIALSVLCHLSTPGTNERDQTRPNWAESG